MRVAANDGRHNRCIGDPQTLDSNHFQLMVDYAAHSTGPDRMAGTDQRFAQPAIDLVVALDLSSCGELRRDQGSGCRRFEEPPDEPEPAPESFTISFGAEEVELHGGKRHRIGR